MRNLPEDRTCGGCTACCKTHGVAELQKPGGTLCSHCDEGVGCRIYDRRPEACRTYRCSWLISLGLEEYRPDKTGIVPDHVTIPSLGLVLWLHEARKGKLKSRFARRQTRLNLEAGNAVFHVPTIGPAKLFVPEKKWDPELAFRFDSKQRVVVIRARPEMFREPA